MRPYPPLRQYRLYVYICAIRSSSSSRWQAAAPAAGLHHVGVPALKIIGNPDLEDPTLLKLSEVSKRGWREGVGDQQRPK